MSPARPGLRVAMWSGPRNISTALMRSWGNRPDTIVCDEPLYAHYLTRADVDHPGAMQIIRHHETDWRKVVDRLTGPIPDGKSVFYQKQMAHHLLPHIERGWLDSLRHAFLIREPKEMLTSLMQILPRPTLADTGLPQQVEIFERIHGATGRIPPVIDARDVLQDPARLLARLCEGLGVTFLPEMLHWAAGPRDTDGVWARHWYGSVEQSTGFLPYRPKNVELPRRLESLHEECLEPYHRLWRHRLTATAPA